MLPVSSAWAPALATDHGLVVSVKALYDGVVTPVTFSDGSVSVDRGSDIRRSLSLTIPDPANFPVAVTDTFGVYGQRLSVTAGIAYIDGTTETVPVGTFVVTKIGGNIHTGPLTVTAEGMEILVKREPFDAATSTSGSVATAAFIRDQLAVAIPGVAFVDESTAGANVVAAKTWNAGTDRWSALMECATAAGADLFCDANGTFVLRDVPDIATQPPIWTVSAGDNGVMTSAEMSLSGDNVFNRVVATGENTAEGTPPVSGEAKITDAADPLRYDGPFGRVTKYYNSSLLTDSGLANGAANALLRRYRAPNRTVKLGAIPNYALEAGDCMRVDYGAAAPPELHLAQSFTLPLAVGGGFSIETVSGEDA